MLHCELGPPPFISAATATLRLELLFRVIRKLKTNERMPNLKNLCRQGSWVWNFIRF